MKLRFSATVLLKHLHKHLKLTHIQGLHES